jgi:hypothetical protein
MKRRQNANVLFVRMHVIPNASLRKEIIKGILIKFGTGFYTEFATRN